MKRWMTWMKRVCALALTAALLAGGVSWYSFHLQAEGTSPLQEDFAEPGAQTESKEAVLQQSQPEGGAQADAEDGAQTGAPGGPEGKETQIAAGGGRKQGLMAKRRQGPVQKRTPAQMPGSRSRLRKNRLILKSSPSRKRKI